MAESLSQSLKTKVGIKSLYIQPFTSIVMEGFYVLDQQHDTLINTPKLSIALNEFSLFNSIREKHIDFRQIELDNGSIYLKKYKDGTANLSFIIRYFSSPDTTKKPKTPGKPFKLDFEKVVLNNMHFRYKNYRNHTSTPKQVNFNDADVRNFSITIKNMDLANHVFKGDISNATFHDKSGFYVKNFTGNATVDTNQIEVKHLLVQTPHSIVKDYVRMKFKSFDDFDAIESRVYMDGDFKSSQVSSQDIAYFTEGLEKIKFDLGLSGQVKGYVNNLKARNMLITGGKASYIKGDFNLRGLPDWNNTFLDLNFEQVATNKADMDYLYSNFSGTPNRHVPDLLAKFGNINFKGHFTGLQNDFVAQGTFKTKLGRFDPDINLKTDKAGNPAYSGKIDAYAFDIGTLTDQGLLNRATFTANVSGSGSSLKNLNGKVDADISSIDFKGYIYQKVKINGTFTHKLATAIVSIDDKNIKLGVNGSVDLNAAVPAYDFTANIEHAHLHTLNLSADTLSLTTQATAKFTGNELNNLTGNVSLMHTEVEDPRTQYLIDSLVVTAGNVEDGRRIRMQSDIADGYIEGKYDLETLPSYFKTVIKKYIPSLKATITPPKPEDFTFNLQLKKPNALIAVFVPSLKIPDQGTFVGTFNSERKTASLNAYVKTIQYDNIVFHDFIIDENTSEDNLALNVSLSKINFTDSLFVKDITLVNTLRRDSLKFNIKLADKNAVNQMDLYGLVNFGDNRSADIQLQPSDLTLEHQDWRIAQNTSFKLLDGKTSVSGLEISNGQQKVLIEGLISDNPNDKLKITFDKFSMATLNQLTRREGVLFKGTMNGDVNVSAITKSPGIDAKLGIDSLMMNKTLVGDVKIESDLDNSRKQANAKLNIHNHGLETMNISGKYLIGHNEPDGLDFDVKMNQTEAIIFEPFIKDIISNVKGTVSTDLKLSGTPSKPQLNGTIILSNTGVTVNYLKTAYTVTDTLNVAKSVIDVKNMTLRDEHEGHGTANGKVDLNDLANPEIHINLDARNMMALNTSFKDNHLYYGTAYATGAFSFNGPLDNMNIDIKARTTAGTVFNIPLNTSSTTTTYDFIRFVGHNETTAAAAANTNPFNGVTLNFDLSADESTTVKITTDYGVIEGTGKTTSLKLNINSLGDFEMFGDYLITNGKFEFTAKNFISKNFTINQGGTIRWTGNPSNATINLSAVYEVRTDISPLYQAAGSESPKGKSYELVQADLILTKSLLQPTIDFDFNFPLDPSIKDDLSNYLSDVNNRNQQALSIIVRRQFANGASNNLTNQVLGTAGEAVTEFAFNKVNSFISQSNIKNLDLNIRSFNDFSASYRIKDRLVFTGSLFNTYSGTSDLFQSTANTFNTSFNQLTYNFDAQYFIQKNGNLAVRYSYRVLNSTTLNTLYNQFAVQYVNGLGLVYQKDFDSFGELIRSIFKKDQKKQPVMPAPIPATTAQPVGPAGSEEDEDQ